MKDKNEKFARHWALAGAAAWAVIAGLAGGGHAPFGQIELLFLLAPLVVVPLAWELMTTATTMPESRGGGWFRRLQPLASASAIAAFWLGPGKRSGALALPWLALCGCVCLARFREMWARRDRSLESMITAVACADLAVGGVWLVISRLGWHPAYAQEPIVLLTATHFHYSGFATAVLAAVMVRKSRGWFPVSRVPAAVALLVCGLPFAVAAGFVFSPVLRAVAAGALALAMTGLATLQFRAAAQARNKTAAIFLRISATAVIAGVSLAAVYAAGELLGAAWITIPRMANTHGLLNGIGFVLFGLLGWRIEVSAAAGRENEDENRNHRRDGLCGPAPGEDPGGRGTRNRADRAWAGPARFIGVQFAAHDFHDR
jgi:hypothetical protein